MSVAVHETDVVRLIVCRIRKVDNDCCCSYLSCGYGRSACKSLGLHDIPVAKYLLSQLLLKHYNLDDCGSEVTSALFRGVGMRILPFLPTGTSEYLEAKRPK